ncbi:acyltransferase family protein [Agromyces seonyuensis]|uniref:Acyltransferase family protein n=1 Tax=Agromyces seonyuensis TaxID=2662446 RepID=A0A6I4NUY9_9MICO|nr:acyltransferase family protein [Agromyces seonyuensis]MWB98110.1 acyltransferase family protein [Agromyces seonyuensis]
MPERSAAIDALRVLGMVAVIACHIWMSPEAARWLGPWVLPLYFVLSGYLWSGRRGPKEEAVLRAKALLVPYAAWFVIIASITWTVWSIRGTFDLRHAAIQVWGGAHLSSPFHAFWFTPALFVAVMVYYWVGRLHLAWQWPIAIALFMIVAYTPGLPLYDAPLSIGQGVGSVIFLVAGRTLRIVGDRIPRPPLLGAAMIFVGLCLMLRFPESYLDVKLLYFGLPAVGIATAILVGGGLVLVADVLFGWIRGRAAVFVIRLSMATLVVLFVHVPIAAAFDWLATGSLPGFVVTTVLSWTIGVVLVALPKTEFLTGVRVAPPALQLRSVRAKRPAPITES